MPHIVSQQTNMQTYGNHHKHKYENKYAELQHNCG